MTLLDIRFLRTYQSAWNALRDPNVKDEDIPEVWVNRVLDVQNRRLDRLKAEKVRQGEIRERRKRGRVR